MRLFILLSKKRGKGMGDVGFSILLFGPWFFLFFFLFFPWGEQGFA